ncbi:ABC transporter substrate-binding protein [Variovorax sp. J22R133]|uniref:ABC transporter substrate-binding protein n=1 Tax=Variovorax brevis TaxID=3053503 RepID=UPI0025765AF9|nr:ABC transporter substrate-binding protein [Variovorax sp. J22R133]MDM0114071.1 ABC transporter substrate-binding protein [Variovorax sp. J22R133]
MKFRWIAAALAVAALVSPAYAADKIKVGFLSTLSGPGGALGVDIRDGFQLALKHRQGKLGGLAVEINVVDDQQSADVGRQAAERMLKRDKVDVMTGMVFSNVLLPLMPSILANDTVYLSTNTGPAEYAGEKCNKNFFAVAWQNEDIPAAMGQYVSDKGHKSVYLIAPNYPGGRESIGGFKRLYKGKIAEEVYVKMGQLDFSSELAQLRASGADSAFFFLPGGMGISFIKQLVASGLSKDVTLYAPGFSGDQDTIKAVGEPMLGMFNSSQWAADLPGEANAKFVADFEKEYGRIPTLYASQGYDAAMLLDGAVRDVKGKIEDKDALRKALRAANFKSVRGNFKFNTNQFPIQNYYLRVVGRDKQGRIDNKTLKTILTNYHDPFASSCKMQ